MTFAKSEENPGVIKSHKKTLLGAQNYPFNIEKYERIMAIEFFQDLTTVSSCIFVSPHVSP